MDPGMLREAVEIWKTGCKADEIGNQIPEKNLYYKCRAYVNNLSGTEYWAAAQVKAEETVVFSIRCCKKVRDMNVLEYSITCNGQSFNITSIDNVMNKNETVKIRAVRRTNGEKSEN